MNPEPPDGIHELRLDLSKRKRHPKVPLSIY